MGIQQIKKLINIFCITALVVGIVNIPTTYAEKEGELSNKNIMIPQ
jgi:hypothetical protein